MTRRFQGIDGFAKWLGKAGLDLSVEEVADIFWLASQIRPATQPYFSEVLSPPKESASQTQRLTSKLPAGHQPPRRHNLVKDDEKTSSAFTPDPVEHTSRSVRDRGGLNIQLPAAQALRQRLQLGRELRPLMRKVPSPARAIVDEDATVAQFAEQKIAIPVMTPEPERWLELALVVEDSHSAPIWERTVEQFKQLLERQGAFRTVQRWRLFAEDSDIPKLALAGGSGASTLRSHRELIDPARRRSIWIVSDCRSRLWHRWNPRGLQGWMHEWSQFAQIAVIQLLPEQMWTLSALGKGDLVWLHGCRPGVPNRELKATEFEPAWEVTQTEARYSKQWLTFPVVTLEPQRVKTYTRVVAGSGDAQTLGIRFDRQLIEALSSAGGLTAVTERLSAEERVTKFRLTSSLLAKKLAGYMAAAPVSIPVIHLLQETLLPQSGQIHVAEVLMSQLITPIVDRDCNRTVGYEFACSDVRYELRKHVSERQIERVLDVVSEYIANRLGLQVSSFEALLAHDWQLGDSDQRELLPFAEIATDVLRQLGGVYEEFAKLVDPSRPKPLGLISSDWPPLQRFEFEVAEILPIAWPEILTQEVEVATIALESEVTDESQETSAISIFEEVASNILSLPEEERLKWVGALRDSLFTESGGFSEVFAPNVVAERWGISNRELLKAKAILAKKDIRRVLEALAESGANIVSQSTINKKYNSQTYLDLFQRIISDEYDVKSRESPKFNDRLVFTYSEVYLMAAHFAWLPLGLRLELPDELQDIARKLGELKKAPEVMGSESSLTSFSFDVGLLERERQQSFRDISWRFRTEKGVNNKYDLHLGNGAVLEMVFIPEEDYIRDLDEIRDKDESRPYIRIDSFFLGKYPVTQAQWRAVAEGIERVEIDLKADPSRFKGEQRPVERVSWFEAQEFCARLRKVTGREYRLPTEMEWEVACRAKTETPFHFGETISPDVANYSGKYSYEDGPVGENREQTTPVGSFGVANRFGLYDMHGNVWEWCENSSDDQFARARPGGTPWNEIDRSKSRVLRGGSWIADPRDCRSAYRVRDQPDYQVDNIGFRVACSPARSSSPLPS